MATHVTAMRPGSSRAIRFPRIALFTDVDGTILDATERLAINSGDVVRISRKVELILASSRTLVELGPVQRRLGITSPMIAENGAVVSFPPRWRGSLDTKRQVVVLGDGAARLRPRVRRCAAEAGVAIADQRDILPDRGRSLQRRYSICVRDWDGPSAEHFLELLRLDGLNASRSGKWITITSGADKGMGVRTVLERAEQLGAPFRKTVAIGNASNDQPLLAAADARFAIRNPRTGHHAHLLDLPAVTALRASGQRAWREALTSILANGKP
jgi:predicted mannosyl-3-phosphoglycerate phosphatase (HAD superfamily)